MLYLNGYKYYVDLSVRKNIFRWVFDQMKGQFYIIYENFIYILIGFIENY